MDPRRLLKFRHTEEEIIRNNEIVRRELRNWDLWGPLIICTTLGIVQSSSAPAEQTSLVFASVFFIVWGGGAVLTLNAQLLGTPLSFFQSICLLGYSIFPLALASIFSLLSKSSVFRLPLLTIEFPRTLPFLVLFFLLVGAVAIATCRADEKQLVCSPTCKSAFEPLPP